jgi:hypothetical protein
MSITYIVPGDKNVIAQPSSMACWATVYTMMKSWKDQMDYDIGTAVEKVGHKYGEYFRKDTGLPPGDFGPFLDAAGMSYDQMQNPSIDGWLGQLKSDGLLWVGTLAAVGPGSGLHSRIIEGMSGDGTPSGTWFSIIDPAGGRRYLENIDTFVLKYEGAIKGQAGTYYQIRHF